MCAFQLRVSVSSLSHCLPYDYHDLPQFSFMEMSLFPRLPLFMFPLIVIMIPLGDFDLCNCFVVRIVSEPFVLGS